MAELYDISNWTELPWYNTGGTRNKKIYLNPDNNQIYYFKESFNKGARDYKYEFWSEILASEIGKALGFPTLQYDIGKREDVFGCISKSMINLEKEELVEGVKYLSSFDPNFILNDERPGKKYTFQLINDSLVKLGLEQYLANILDIIVFDALIGNSDRHQENWAIIQRIKDEAETPTSDYFFSWNRRGLFSKKAKRSRWDNILNYSIWPALYSNYRIEGLNKFAPIYDSGCCFGRELTDSQIEGLLASEDALRAHVLRGKSEIHYEEVKLSHFELLQKLLEKEEHKEIILKRINLIISRFNINQVSEIVYNVDSTITDNGVYEGLPRLRKEFIMKLLTLRMDELRKLVDPNQ